MIDYYSVLEINESASKETIEKVHKLLIKKYHPDLQPEENKKEAEEQMKLINEAYEVLTDPVKKQQYDNELKEFRMQEIIEEMKRSGKFKQETKQNINNGKNNQNEYTEVVTQKQEQGSPFNVTDEEIRRQAQVYYDELYNQYLYRNGYIRDKKQDFRDWLAKVLTIIIMIGILFAIIKIPYTRNLIKEFVSSNFILDGLLGKFFE
ncbi:MAG: hypothetical protein E7311_03955 [Clostridiales bacterium]|nr:hypothetical protein [Clostridiales bacterium]